MSFLNVWKKLVQQHKSRVVEGQAIRTVANISAVNDLVHSQEDAPHTHWTTQQIARETGIHHSSVVRIIQDELHLKCVKKRYAQELSEANCITRLSRAKKLSKFADSAIDFIFFTDEKVFTVASPLNLQNDRIYADVQQVCHGVCRGLKSWMHWSLWSREWR